MALSRIVQQPYTLTPCDLSKLAVKCGVVLMSGFN